MSQDILANPTVIPHQEDLRANIEQRFGVNRLAYNASWQNPFHDEIAQYTLCSVYRVFRFRYMSREWANTNDSVLIRSGV